MEDEKRDLLYKDIKQVRQGSIKFSKGYKAKLALKQVFSIIGIALLVLVVSYLGYRITDNSVPTPEGRVAYTEALKDARTGDQIILYKNKFVDSNSFDFINKILSHIGIQKIETAKVLATPQSMLLPDDNGNNIVLSESQFFVELSSGRKHIVGRDMILGIVENGD